MPTYKSRLINCLLRNRHILKGRYKKEVYDFSTSITAFREQCEKGAARFGKIPEGIEIKADMIQGIKSEWIIPAGACPDKLILYVHGGGYVSGSCNDHRGVVSKFAKQTGILALTYEYRLAPEYPYPAALDDSVLIYKGLLAKGIKPENILIAGESAGGGLCLALLLALKDKNLPMPVAALAISPWADLTCSGDSYRTKNKRSLAPLNSWTVFSKYYAGDNPASMPLISPLFGDLTGLPPLFINAGMDDELYDDAEQFAFRAKEAGVDLIFKAGGGMVHCYPLLAPMFREATEAMEEIVGFCRRSLKVSRI
jgi:epsilon-lactone hydrolase